MNDSNAREIYADIIDLPHHQSSSHKHMSLYDRAAQFAPFAALVGYDEMIVEEGRLTDEQLCLTEEEIDILNRKLEYIRELLARGERPEVAVTYFVPDSRKAGGSYETLTAPVKRIDDIQRIIVLYGSYDVDDRRVPTEDIPINRVTDIRGEIFESAQPLQ